MNPIHAEAVAVSGIDAEIVRKPIKNLHLGVYPPDGRVRVAVPIRIDDDAVRLAVITRSRWIRKQRRQFDAQERQSRREMVSGESHYVEGRRCRLHVVEHDGPASILLPNNCFIELKVRSGSTREQREAVLQRWYRKRHWRLHREELNRQPLPHKDWSY
ncbi:YgjP-like metallopeptidase domain-containing protein [Candidatus Chloroploca asiatica]|uniref:YgjP-like metallopeptidase domain-containing protein n=1 Tax=Candidatus Chloroploca asiatica TaxID=1506545 RepID=A0A2H3KKC4_9CHLR|nr:YgjP-like metallopeptidase domain-containing protein [Candidatus Chloroploca asiatica]PDV98376.1 hypothetical protein A9Q02_15560 [Candidatus Chloroploca asiatica]